MMLSTIAVKKPSETEIENSVFDGILLRVGRRVSFFFRIAAFPVRS